MEEWAVHRGKQKRKKPVFNMKFHFFLGPETTKTQFSPAGSSGSNGFGRWSASYEGNREKQWQARFFQAIQRLSDFWFKWLKTWVAYTKLGRYWEPLHGQVSSAILGWGQQPLKCQGLPQAGPICKQTHRVPTSITGSWQIRAGRHLRHGLIQTLTQEWLTVPQYVKG